MSEDADAAAETVAAAAADAALDDPSSYEEDSFAFGDHSASSVAPLSTIATAMLFGSITFATASLAARSYLTGDVRSIRTAFNPRASPLDVRSFASLYTLLHHFTVFGLILFFAYVCEYHPPFPHGDKSYDRDEFFFLTATLFVAAAYTVARNDRNDPPPKKKKSKGGAGLGRSSSNVSNGSNGHHHHDARSVTSTSTYPYGPVAPAKASNDVLNRDQTEEWKGWMQFMFLLYHYYHAEETYNAIRIMITCYVWMTGFGNFSFFYLKADYSLVRVLQMLWRLNFLVAFLCLSQGTTYILYYICPLHTYFFFMVYVTMRVGRHLNYTKYGVRLKLGVVAILIFLLWDVDSGLFGLVHFPFLDEKPGLGATSGSMWEWYFRSTLDHWSTFLGMIFAANFPITSLFYRKLEASPPLHHFLGKALVAAGLLVAFYIWVSGPFMLTKVEYNATNSYFGFVPLITYIYFRNLTPTLRSYSLDLLHQIGKTTLETYLMQHHIWLTSDAKSLLILVPGWPKVNMLVVTLIYFYTSRRLYKLTLFLRGMLLPDDRSKCVRSLLVLGAVIGTFFGMALTLQSFDMVSLPSVAVVSIVCGLLLYQTIMDRTWRAYQESAPNRPASSNSSVSSIIDHVLPDGIPVADSNSPIAKLSPPIIGSMVVLIIGLTWHNMAQTNAGKIRPLPAGCDAMVNDGAWIPLDGCNGPSRGVARRNYGLSNYATCSPSGGAQIWAWNETESYTRCRFSHRDAKSLKKSLEHRKLTFVGDSNTRNLYHATCRALGVKNAGAYDATVTKHSDMNAESGSTKVEFFWAPLATDQIVKFQDLNRDLIGPDKKTEGRPDLVVAGGGAWDRLHVFATDENRDSHRANVKELAKEMKRTRDEGRTPVVWTVPTTINSKALPTEDKRANMKEEDMEPMRALYAQLGVLDASSFVLDGPSFTRGRASESYDGVHYPPGVYDAGAQMLANAMDWLLRPLDGTTKEPYDPPQPGKMANPSLGLMMLCFVFVGLMFFDGFMGFSYLACVVVRGIMPTDLYDEAFEALHRAMKLPPVEGGGGGGHRGERKAVSRLTSSNLASRGGGGDGQSPAGGRRHSRTPSLASSVDEEIAALLGGGGADDLELAPTKK